MSNNNKRPVILIASRGRSGSYMLQSSLAVAGCAMLRECFHLDYCQRAIARNWAARGMTAEAALWDMKTPPTEWLMREWAKRPDACAVGAILHPWQAESVPEAAKAFVDLGAYVVVLHRCDLVAQFASQTLAIRYNRWESTAEYPPLTDRLSFNLYEFRQYCDDTRNSVLRDLDRYADRPRLILTYEQMVGHFERTMEQLGAWLNLDLAAALPRTIKRERRPIEQIVTNYEAAAEIAGRYEL